MEREEQLGRVHEVGTELHPDSCFLASYVGRPPQPGPSSVRVRGLDRDYWYVESHPGNEDPVTAAR